MRASASARALLALTMAMGCGGGEAPAAPVTEVTPVSPATPEIVPAPTQPIAPPSAPAAPTATPALPGAHPGEATSGPAFVVYVRRSYSMERATLVVPVAPTTPARSTSGIVVLDSATEPPELEWVAEADDVPSPCDCACEGAAALGEDGAMLVLDPTSFTVRGEAPGCVVLPEAEACGGGGSDEDEEEEDEDEDDDQDGEDDGEEDEYGDEEDCESAGGIMSTLVGGRFFVPLDTHEGCGGLNLYGNDLRSFSITRTAWTVPALPASGVTCEPHQSTGGWPDVREEVAPLSCTRGRRGWSGDDDCSACEEAPGLVVARVTRGMLQLIDVRVTGDGDGTAWLSETRLTPANCPSSADPCGSPTSFPTIATLPARSDFWVATNGSAALTLTPDGYDRATLRLHAPERAAAVRELSVPFDANEVLGVRFHRDAALLARLVDHGLPTPHPRSCTTAPSAPGPTVIAPASPIATTCELGQRRGAAGTCEAIPLAASDEGFVDPREGSEWGNRCAVHLREGDLDAAEAACARGMAIATRDTTRGALLYNLGRIAEARGDRAGARARYERSLAVRPGNAAVQAALDALGD